MRHRSLPFTALLLALTAFPALAATTYRINLNYGYDVTQSAPFSHAVSGPIGASNGTATFSGSGFANPGHVGCFNRSDMTWTSGLSGGCGAEVYCSSRTEDFVISGPPGPPVPGSLHFRVAASFARLGGFPNNGGQGGRLFIRVSVNGIVATGDYSIGNNGVPSTAGLLAGLSGDAIDRSFDIAGNFPVGSPFVVELFVQTNSSNYGNVFTTNPGFSQIDAGSGSPSSGLRLQEVSGVVMTLPAGYTLNSAAWGITDNRYTSPVAVEPAVPQADFRLVAEPNPSAGAVTLRFAQPGEGAVAIDVFDASGRHVRRLAHGWRPAGASIATWDGRDAGGTRVPGGIYFARFEGAGRVLTRRIVRLE